MSPIYRLSPSGRRYNLLMIAVAMLLWVFALWSIASMLRLSFHPSAFWADLQRLLAQPPVVEQVVPALLLLTLVVATPFLIWNLIAEWDAVVRIDENGLRYETMGIRLCCRWSDITAVNASADEIILCCRHDPAEAIANPLLRWLHRQAHGRYRLRIGAEIERRDELVAALAQSVRAPEEHAVTPAA